MELNEMQIKLLRGSFPKIASKVDCSTKYVSMVVNGKVEDRDTELVKSIEKEASELLSFFQPLDK